MSENVCSLILKRHIYSFHISFLCRFILNAHTNVTYHETICRFNGLYVSIHIGVLGYAHGCIISRHVHTYRTSHTQMHTPEHVHTTHKSQTVISCVAHLTFENGKIRTFGPFSSRHCSRDAQCGHHFLVHLDSSLKVKRHKHSCPHIDL